MGADTKNGANVKGAMITSAIRLDAQIHNLMVTSLSFFLATLSISLEAADDPDKPPLPLLPAEDETLRWSARKILVAVTM